MQSVTIPFEFDHRGRLRLAFRRLNVRAGYEAAASELLGSLPLADKLLRRVRRKSVGANPFVEPMTTEDSGPVDSVAVLMEDALEPALVETLNPTPAPDTFRSGL